MQTRPKPSHRVPPWDPETPPPTEADAPPWVSPDGPDLPPPGGAGTTDVGPRSTWPGLDDAAYHGLAGEIVETILPHTEADPAAMLVQLLAAFGAWVGAAPHLRVGAERHPARLYVAVVGGTSLGRKGTSWGEVRRVLALADPEWMTGPGRRVVTGLSSGEGLIHAVRDEVRERETDPRTGDVREVVKDPGVQDKRLLVTEPEFASVLTRARREGNVLSATLRQAWDSGDLASLVRNGGAGGYRATGAHVAVIAHVTPDELLRVLDATEQANGFGNRFLWVCSRRSKLLPEGGALGDDGLAPHAARLRRAAETARTRGELRRAPGASLLWRAEYAALNAAHPGIYGELTARGAPHVLRLSLLYALLDGSPEIGAVHIAAALAVWRYCAASVRQVWGVATGNTTADTILAALRATHAGLTRTQIRDLFHRHQSATAIDRALTTLTAAGCCQLTRRATGGRPTEVWTATPGAAS